MGVVLTMAMAAVACQDEKDHASGSSGQGGAGAVGSGGSSSATTGGNGGAGAGGGDVGGLAGAGGLLAGSGGGGAGGASCVGVAVVGERVPLDLYLMLDRSGSMADATGSHGFGPPKWQAVTRALTAFFADEGSAGLGVGLQFFPATLPGVPETCESNAECGSAGPCLLKICSSALDAGSVVACESNADCPLSDCVTMGRCSLGFDHVCRPGIDASCGSYGVCEGITRSTCAGAGSCAAASYAHPAVEIATLNGASDGLAAAIAATAPGGVTPTAPALDGAIQHARSWAMAHPDHKVVTVLATDGLPTDCAVQDIPSIAALAAAGSQGTPSVPTFVIGVFGQSAAGAQASLDTIADQGGSGKAFFITDDQDVEAAFLAALRTIQGKTLGCEYQLPVPPDGSELDYDEINVEYTPAGGTTPEALLYVAAADKCDEVTGGWYYDADPAAGGKPGRILMCPSTCAVLKEVGIGGRLGIEMGCQTIVPEPW